MEKMWILQKEAPDKFHEPMFLEIKDLEGQKFREELDVFGKKHRLERLKKKRERARVLEGETAACGGRCSYRYGKWTQGKCTGPKYLSKNLGTWKKRHLEGHDMVRRMDR